MPIRLWVYLDLLIVHIYSLSADKKYNLYILSISI